MASHRDRQGVLRLFEHANGPPPTEASCPEVDPWLSKLILKPNERIIIGNSVIRNGEQRTRFFIEGEAPICGRRTS